jgi:hypothetical protein
MRIIKLIASLDNHGLKVFDAEWTFIKEAPTYYEIKSEMKTKRLKRELLNVIQTDVVNNTEYISYSVFCEIDKKDDFIPLLLCKVESQLNKLEESIQKKRQEFNKSISRFQ